MTPPTYPDNSTQLTQRAQVWSRYWAQGAGHSCAGSFGERYDGAIGAWWQQVFGALPHDAAVLDLATGSGAVLRLGLDHAPATVRLDGVDLAQVAPPWLAALPARDTARVRVHPGVCTERLPFADARFSVVTSQFGIEYTELERSLAEVRRVLRPDGALRFVLHHARSRTLQLARVELEHIAWLFAPDGLLQTVAHLAEPFSRAATLAGRAHLARDARANALRDRFNGLQDQRAQLAADSICPDVLNEASEAASQVLMTAAEVGVAAGQSVAQAFTLQLRDSRLRLEELIRYALDEAALQAVREQLAAGAMTVEAGELRGGEHLFGWWLIADPVKK